MTDLSSNKTLSHMQVSQLTWKLECDGISESEWQALATMTLEYLKEPLAR